MKINDVILKRFTELDTQGHSVRVNHSNNSADGKDVHAWGTSVLSLLHNALGRDSVHFKNFEEKYKAFHGWEKEFEHTFAVFKAAKADYEGGYIFNLESLIAGELFADFIDLAKESLKHEQKDVAAVLACAALEDTLKKYAKLKGLQVDGKEMSEVVNAIKSQGLVTGAQKGLLDTMPKIRNYAMHADWGKITPQDVGSVIGFVEQFLITNF